MILAATDMLLVIIALFLLGLVGLVLGAIMYGLQLIGWLWRVLFVRRDVSQHQPYAIAHKAQQGRGVCHHPKCGHINRPGSRYCSMCGWPLEQHQNVNAYG
jgi:hypothetical protein